MLAFDRETQSRREREKQTGGREGGRAEVTGLQGSEGGSVAGNEMCYLGEMFRERSDSPFSPPVSALRRNFNTGL